MKTKLMLMALLSALLVAGCAVPAAAPGVPAQPPGITPTPPPSPLPGVTPGDGLITRPTAEEWGKTPAAALKARADLAERLQIDPDTIKLVSVETVNWPNGCLGVQTPGVMCTMVITPGYRVTLEAGGKQYEYHTSASGDAVRLAAVQ